MTSFGKKIVKNGKNGVRREKKNERINLEASKHLASCLLAFWCRLCSFLLLFARLTYMQVYNKSFYTKKLEDNSKYTVRIASERGQIFDARGLLLRPIRVRMLSPLRVVI